LSDIGVSDADRLKEFRARALCHFPRRLAQSEGGRC
jgi:hypothetical protein